MNGSFRLGTAFGIGIFVHWTFGLLLAWIAMASLSHGGGVAELLATLVLVVGVFGCLTLHELGHSLAARHYGIPTRHITLLPIGGVAMLERMPRNPRHELVIAVAGPAVNVAIIGVLIVVSFIGGIGSTLTGMDLLLGGGLIANLLVINVILVLFNMIPAFPMDGGRVLRALLAMRITHLRATEIAVSIGKVFALALGVFGLFNNPILIITALFVYFGAEAERRAAIQSVLWGEGPDPAEPARENPRRRAANDDTQPEANAPRWEIVRSVPRDARRLH